MVRKISGSSAGPTKGASAQATKSVGAAELRSTKEVDGPKGQREVSKARQKTVKLSPEERGRLFSMVEEEAGKLFGKEGLPESRREKLEAAVKMAIDAAIIEENGDEG